MNAQHGRFIVLEGIEGAGKSTQMQFVAEWLRRRGIAVDVTREPGGTPLAEGVRKLLLDTANQGMSPDCELLLIFAARADHLQRRIRPALEQGSTVLCDRFTDTSFAYQGGGRGLPLQFIAQLEQQVQQALRPDLVLLLDLPAEIGMARAGRRGAADRFESERMDFFQRARNIYLRRAEQAPGRYRIIDAQPKATVVSAALGKVLEQYFSLP